MRRFIVSGAVAGLLLVGVPAFSATAYASGQPSQSCEEQPSGPAGFNSSGFEDVADANYAGSGAGSLNGNTTTAISQYDVACLQVSQH
jgi:hypothetical protein